MDDTKEENKSFATTTKTWSESIEGVIKNIGESCKGYKWMNIFAAKNSNLIYSILMYTVIFIGPIAGVLSTVATVDEEDGSKELQTSVTMFAFLSGILSAIIKFGKFEEKSSSHKTIAAKYASLEGNIRRQLSLYRNDRVNAGKYLEWVSTSFDDLFASTPLMPDNIYEKWDKFAKENNIAVPEKFGQTIDVIVEDGIDNNDPIDPVDQLCRTESIGVNREDHSVEVIVQGPGTIRRQRREQNRSKTYDAAPDLNRYGDARMKYEMQRLYGMNDS